MKIYSDFPAKEVDELRSRAREAADPDELLAAFPSLKLKQGYKLVSTSGVKSFLGSLSIVWAIPASNRLPTPEECEPIDILKLSRPFDVGGSCFDALAGEEEEGEEISHVNLKKFEEFEKLKKIEDIAGRRGIYEILRPPEALDNLMEAIEGD